MATAFQDHSTKALRVPELGGPEGTSLQPRAEEAVVSVLTSAQALLPARGENEAAHFGPSMADRELQMARQVQQSLLPKTFPHYRGSEFLGFVTLLAKSAVIYSMCSARARNRLWS